MSSYRSELVYGLLLAFASLLWIIFEYAIGLHTTRIEYHPTVSMLFAVIPIGIIWLAIVNRRDKLEGGSLTWWQGLTSGMIVSVVTGASGAPTLWFFTTYINPKFFDSMIDFVVKRGDMKFDQAVGYFSFASYAIQSTLGPVIMGFFTSVILTYLARWQLERKKKAATADTKAS